jgi:hypothetical protein
VKSKSIVAARLRPHFGDIDIMNQIHDEEFAALARMNASDRYSVFLNRVADWEEVWSLRSANGWCLMADESGVEMIPVWPHERCATACASNDDQEQAASIPLEDWLDKWLPGMIKDGRQVAVFPVPTGKGTIVSPTRLRADLLAQCEEYE